jgi:MFS family permease
MFGRRLTIAMCCAQIGSLLPHAAFPALIPLFVQMWGLSASEAGLIAGGFAFGYMCAVPFLSTLTDRVDARLVVVCGSAATAATAAAFALFAHGFWSGLLLWTLAGVAFAGSYMPGLRALTDRIDPGDQSRSITAFTGAFAVGVALSFGLTQELAGPFGWRFAIAVVSLGPLAMCAVALTMTPIKPRPPAIRTRMLDFRPVIRNRAAMAYILGYGFHCFELMAMRSWLVAFWAWVAARHEGSPFALSTTVVSLLVVGMAMPASVFGNELSIRFGRKRTIAAVQIASAATALAIAVTAGLAPAALILALVVLYSITVTADSGSLTSGMVGAAEPSHRGQTMALHSTVGFGLSFVGPVLVGVALDSAGGAQSAGGWMAAFSVMAAGVLFGPPMLRLGRAKEAA